MVINIPLYEYVYNKLKDSIVNGDYVVESKLPSEKDLQRIFDVSRITIRKAVEMLQSEGYVKKYPGIGTIVKDNRQVIKIRNISGFTKDNEMYNPKSELINFEKIIVPLKVQTYLEMGPKTYVYKIERLRFLEQEIVGIHTSYVPAGTLKLNRKDFLLNDSSLYSLFNKNNIQISSAEEVLEVKVGKRRVSKLLEVSEETPLLYVERITYDKVEKPIEYVEIYYCTDKFKYQTKFRTNH